MTFMKHMHLGIQALVVVAMVSFASWPQFRPVRAQSIWRFTPAAALEARTLDAARYAGTPAPSDRSQADSELPSSAKLLPGRAHQSLSTPDAAPLEFTPGAIAAFGGNDNALVGLAQNSLNAAIPRARVVLRDIRTGEALQQTTADELGQFSFVDLAASDYVVELLGPDGAVVGTSEVVKTSKGGLLRTVVRVAAAAAAVAAVLAFQLSPSVQYANTLATNNDVTPTTNTQLPRVTSTGN
jgi:hypothetical protein